MARTKQTARKHLESPKKASAVKKSPAKKSAGNKVLRYVVPTICTLAIVVSEPSSAIGNRECEVFGPQCRKGDSECPHSDNMEDQDH